MDLAENEREFLSEARGGDLERIKALISNGLISLDRHEEIKNVDGRTALHLASLTGHLQIVRFLVEENSVDVDGKDNDGLTALHYASTHGHVDVMKLLIINGANVNRQHDAGWTPLLIASFFGKLSAVKLLLEKGADPHIQNHGNETALDRARRGGHNDVVNAITQHIQRQQQIQRLIRCSDTLPISIWPNAFSRLESINFIFPLVCELPFLFKQAAEKTEEN